MEKRKNTRRQFLKLTSSAVLGIGARRAVNALEPKREPVHEVPADFDVREFGAKGDGKTLDTFAINKAISAAAAIGGGTVHLPAGTYLCYSIHLKSHVTIQLVSGAVILAADPPTEKEAEGYDFPESNKQGENYQDFGHSHWHNSRIWG